jgi:predicted transposase YdaD
MELMTSWERKGLEKGREEGREEGIRNVAQKLL